MGQGAGSWELGAEGEEQRIEDIYC